MLYIGVSAFTINSAGFVYNRAGALRLYITDDMVRRMKCEVSLKSESSIDAYFFDRFHDFGTQTLQFEL